MNISKPRRFSGAVLSWALASAAAAADPAHPCAGQYDDAQRLACYDAAFGKPVRPPGAPASAPIARPSAVPPSQPVSAAPMTTPRAGKDAKETRDDTPFSATITALSRPLGKPFVATLDNGQKWTQLEADDKFQIKVGDAVTIRPGIVGSHFLVTRSAGRVRVTLGH